MVDKFKYLGSYMSEQINYTLEIWSHIEQARSAFVNKSKIICNWDKIGIKVILFKYFIFSILRGSDIGRYRNWLTVFEVDLLENDHWVDRVSIRLFWRE